jgi:hypothetical protein
VAVLGTNFVDSPSARVRFDNIDVMPVFHGPRTLICTTPPHHSGTHQAERPALLSALPCSQTVR